MIPKSDSRAAVWRCYSVSLPQMLVSCLIASIAMLTVSAALADISQDCKEAQDNQVVIEACTEDLDAARDDPADSALAHFYRGLAHWREGDLESALDDLTNAIRHDPNLVDAYIKRGSLYRSKRRFDDAANDFEDAAAIVAAATRDNPSEELRKLATIIDDMRAELQLDVELEKLWVDYLKEIQADKDHRNWPEAPYDLYLKNLS